MGVGTEFTELTGQRLGPPTAGVHDNQHGPGRQVSGSGGIDGTYQFALYDSLLFAAGGNIVISGGQVTAIVGTYFNWGAVGVWIALALGLTLAAGGMTWRFYRRLAVLAKRG
jgi:hypothetical protein